MSLDNLNTVDAVGIENGTHHVILTIADSWEWSDLHAHLFALQAKLNTYFDFISSGQIWGIYPRAQGSQVIVDIIFRFLPPKIADDFIDISRAVAIENDIIIRSSTYSKEVFENER